MNQQRYEIVKSRLDAIIRQATDVLEAEQGDQDLRDFVVRKSLARDVVQTASAVAEKLTTDEASIDEAEEIAQTCEHTLAITMDTLRASLRRYHFRNLFLTESLELPSDTGHQLL